ncbi:MAG: hypothetical protein F6J87_29365 [Spirulina sp. SIO3F2]|nr:hypothetical protein [Spirulina sp. SIO3F2]
MPSPHAHNTNTVIQGEFVEPARSPAKPPNPSPWQQRRNGKGLTFHAELARLEGHLDEQFTNLHQHFSQNHNAQNHNLSVWLTQIDGRILQRLNTVDRKLNAILLAQRARSKQLLTLWLMGLLAVLGIYITLIHPLLRPAQPTMPMSSAPQPKAMPTPTVPKPTVPLPHEIPQN